MKSSLTPFQNASYLAQVRRLRRMAEEVMRRYPVGEVSLRFLSHGENTTFRVTAKKGQTFLLRIHRPDYHTQPAIREELGWLRWLSDRTSLSVPIPVRSRGGSLLETVKTPEVGERRNCSLLKWIPGRFVRSSVRPLHMVRLGRMIGLLHKASKGRVVRQRRYWDAEGLVGRDPKFGPTERLPETASGHQRLINERRSATHRALKEFEALFPRKQGWIHADLHLGNVLFTKNDAAPIDFDDCGFGFHAYDLAVPLVSVSHLLPKGGKREFKRMKDALIQGYSAEAAWDEDDEVVLGHLITARKLAMLGWLTSRSDNPKIRRFIGRAVASAVRHLRAEPG